jgi:hypothetical protein
MLPLQQQRTDLVEVQAHMEDVRERREDNENAGVRVYSSHSLVIRNGEMAMCKRRILSSIYKRSSKALRRSTSMAPASLIHSLTAVRMKKSRRRMRMIREDDDKRNLVGLESCRVFPELYRVTKGCKA